MDFLKTSFIGDVETDIDYNGLEHESKIRKQTSIDNTFLKCGRSERRL